MATVPIVCRFCRKPVTFKPAGIDGRPAVFCGCTSVRIAASDKPRELGGEDTRARLDILFGEGAGDAVAAAHGSHGGTTELARPVPTDLHPDLLALAYDLLRIAADQFSNHSANHFDLPDLAPEATQQLADLMNANRGDDERDVASDFGPGKNAEDWCLMNALGAGLLAMSGRTR